jgi:hypothetical protein
MMRMLGLVFLAGILQASSNPSRARAATIDPGTGAIVNGVCLASSGVWSLAFIQPVGNNCVVTINGFATEPGRIVAGWMISGVWVSNLCRAGGAFQLYAPFAAQPVGTLCTVGLLQGVVSQL